MLDKRYLEDVPKCLSSGNKKLEQVFPEFLGIEDGYTIIGCCFENNNCFIFNRNQNMIGLLFKDKYLRFWGFENYFMDGWEADSIEILTLLPYSNKNHKDQAIINQYKKHYINLFEQQGYVVKDIDENEEIKKVCSLALNENINNFRKKWREKYYLLEDFCDCLRESGNFEQLVKYNLKALDLKYFENMTFYEIWESNLSYDQIVTLIIRNILLNKEKYVRRKNKH